MSNKKEYRYEYFLSYIGKCDNGNIVNGNLMQKENEKITSVEQIVQILLMSVMILLRISIALTA